MIAIVTLLIISMTAIGWITSSQWRRNRQRSIVASKPFPTLWRNILKKRFPYFKAMPTDLQLQLKKHIQVFISEKQFVGCDGFDINDEVKVTIAAQACLLLLNRKTDYYPKLKQILVYPSAFIVHQNRTDIAGVYSTQRNVLLGESWEYGKVVLSWNSTVEGAADPFDGSNVVIHEFAHQLDQEDGSANGAPPLRDITSYRSWSATLGQEFKQLQHCAQQHIPSLFNYYGATNPAEFFAVISETFFERPIEFYQQHNQLYKELSQFYQLDPINWH
ncbi:MULTISPECIES: M90 family metallopeptidase [Shewanella]|uniref:M90 family metallopeptidase n=1 Tax=Shewanella TaxID=22 RepID=UPI000C62424F|nr:MULTISPECIES: M90 family metallopeptidase [Shewanella]NCQ45591.1 zinc-dependent peptidase [Shewanella frigidimarina]NCO71728.1 zinc-dependent peptidase [Shewanella vesiculosa]NCP37639.1 zinc-dependent peptidase [Shewanella vesiculosa]NCP69369.1 zinc-dependent peptidase [Shewanella vesiculosa]NCP75260.1 zinc-dependent peptidase [Shewanella vesiculosa]